MTETEKPNSTEYTSDDIDDLARRIDASWEHPDQLDAEAITTTVDLLDHGILRVCAPPAAHNDAADEKPGEDEAREKRSQKHLGEGTLPTPWHVQQWVKKAVLLYFRVQPFEEFEAGPLEFRDKVRTKHNLAAQQVRVVPPGVARYGSYLAPGVVMMPSYVNIGAYVDSGTMVDTWATVGSCAQIGKNVHLAGGVGIGGVLEPVQASPVIVEDDAFIGSRCIVVEGAHVGRGAVLGANVVITASTPVIDVTGTSPKEHRGVVPERAIVIPGNRPKDFAAGHFAIPCGLIIGYRSAATDDKVAVNALLREHGIGV